MLHNFGFKTLFYFRKVTPKKSPPPEDSTSKPEEVSEMKPPPSKALVKPPSRKKGLLEDESSQDFVPIKPKTSKKRVLTDHQKDVMTSRHDDIPALYSELSRDDSVINLPSQVQELVWLLDTFRVSCLSCRC